MKIGLVCPYGVNKGGGVQEIVRALYKGLKERGHVVKIITPKPFNHNGGVEDDVIFVGGSVDFKSPLQTTAQISASGNTTIQEMLDREKFDLIHFHEPWVPMLSAQILNLSTAANVATFHAKLPETMMARTMAKVVTPYTKPLLRYMHALTAPSEAAAEYVGSLTDEPVAIVPNGIDLKDFKRPKTFNDGDKQKSILYVGRLEGRKGVKYLIHAFELVLAKHPKTQLLIAGDGVDRAKLELLVEDLELKNVKFLGFVSHEEKLRLYRSCDLFCAPALFGESFGVVLLEAMASGLVTVAGDNPGYEAVMRDFGALSLVNPKETAELARRLELLLFQPGLRQLWRKWADSEISQYSWEHVVSQYEEVYEEALKRTSKK